MRAILLAILLLPAAPAGAQAPALPDTVREHIVRLAADAGDEGHGLAERQLQTQRLLARFYAGVGNRPVWTGERLDQAHAALAALSRADEHGLLPQDYAVTAPLPAQPGAAPEALARFDIALTGAVLQYLADLHGGRVRPGLVSYLDDVPPSDFDPAGHLRTALEQGRLADALAAAQPPIALYARVKDTLAQYRRLAHGAAQEPALPPLPPGASLRPGMPYPDAARLRARLLLLGDLPPHAAAGDDGRYSPELAEGVRHFQLRHGLEGDGVLGPATFTALAVPLAHRVRQLALTLERLRWIPRLPPGPLIVVNVPAFRLWAFDTRDRPPGPALEMRVIVGSAGRTPTPLFLAQLHHLEFNPYWNVPSSIALGELLPKMARDPDYLGKNAMEIVHRDGRVQRGAAGPALGALRAGTARLRQRPGPRNVLGAVKFAMPNPMNIYLHSTAARELFANARRDLSHGCIRLEKPAELAEFVLRGQPPWDRDKVLAAMAPGKTSTVRLASPIPVILSYATAVVDRNGRALFAEDIYRRDDKLARALGLPEPGGGPGPAPPSRH